MGLPNPFPSDALWVDKEIPVYFTLTRKISAPKNAKQCTLKFIILNRIQHMPEVARLRISKKVVVYRITPKESCMLRYEPQSPYYFTVNLVEDSFKQAIYEANFQDKINEIKTVLGQSYEIGG